jgi:alkylated DNA repair protein (DNA oxidative demethylase)
MKQSLAPGAVLLRRFASPDEKALVADLAEVTRTAPFRHMVTPGGFRMSVAMTNCGALGWVSDPSGYRYDEFDPESGLPWPGIPDSFMRLAREAADEAGFRGFVPDACLVNRYEPGARLTLRAKRVPLEHGDVAVWGGPSRMRFHGVMPLKEGVDPVLGRQRINLTFRKAG